MNRNALLGPYSTIIIIIFLLAVSAEVGVPATGIGQLVWPLAGLNALFVILALIPVRGYVLTVSILCMAVAGTIAFFWNVPGLALAEAFNRSSSIIAFIAVVPSVAIPIRLGGYMDAMEAFLSPNDSFNPTGKASPSGNTSFTNQIARHVKPFVSFLTLACLQLLMTLVLNIGAIPTMQRLLDKARLPKRYLSLLYSTAYSCYMVVSPFDGLINALILAGGTTYAAYASRGLAMTGTIMAAGLLLLAISPRSARPRQPGQAPQSVGAVPSQRPIQNTLGKTPPGRRILELAVHIVTMIALAVLFGRVVRLQNPAMGTAFVILAYTGFWLRLLGISTKQLGGSIREYALALAGFRAFLPFLISASLLGAMSAYTPLNEVIGSALIRLGNLPRYFSIQAIMAVTALLSITGVHMMITVAAVASAVDPAALGLAPPGFVLFLMSCWFVAMNASPFVPFSTVVGEAIGEKPVIVALRYNSRMSLLMLLVAPLVITLV